LAVGVLFAASTALAVGASAAPAVVQVAVTGPIGALGGSHTLDGELVRERPDARASTAAADASVPVTMAAPTDSSAALPAEAASPAPVMSRAAPPVATATAPPTVTTTTAPAAPDTRAANVTAGPGLASSPATDAIRSAAQAQPRVKKQVTTTTTTTTTPPTTTAPPTPQIPAPALGFDTCEAPSAVEMHIWKVNSPYQVAAIYIGGAMRMCSNAVLDTPAWTTTVLAQGWRLMPTYVGPQAPCTKYRARIDMAHPIEHGMEVARDAVAAAGRAGIPPGAPIYYDLENFVPTPLCSWAVRYFLAGWINELRGYGYLPALYSNLDSGVAVALGMAETGTVDAIWVAHWNNADNLTGLPGVPDAAWSSHQRAHQFVGDHEENFGGVKLSVDRSVVDAPTWPRTTGG
jgi:hypothetical protein